MAEVYLGRALQADGRFGPAVAVKRLLPHLTSDAAIVRMFLNEAEITAADPSPERGPHPRPGKRAGRAVHRDGAARGTQLRRAPAGGCAGRAPRAAGNHLARAHRGLPRPRRCPPRGGQQGARAADRPPRLHPRQHPRQRHRRGEGHRLRHRQVGGGAWRDRARHAQGQVLLHVPGDDRRARRGPPRRPLCRGSDALRAALRATALHRPQHRGGAEPDLRGEAEASHRVRPLGAPCAGARLPHRALQGSRAPLPVTPRVHRRHRGRGWAGQGGHSRGGGGLRRRHLSRRGGPEADRAAPRPARQSVHAHPFAGRDRDRICSLPARRAGHRGRWSSGQPRAGPRHGSGGRRGRERSCSGSRCWVQRRSRWW